MNKYPMWKYAIIAIALVVSLVYAAPNLFGEAPAVQVSGARPTVKVDAAMRASLESDLKAAGVEAEGVEATEQGVQFRYADGARQLKARSACIQCGVLGTRVSATT
jgi:preprotein translocase subunit SecD